MKIIHNYKAKISQYSTFHSSQAKKTLVLKSQKKLHYINNKAQWFTKLFNQLIKKKIW